MEPKAEAIRKELAKSFPEGRVEYQFANELHKYRLERDGPTHWLYVERNFLDDTQENELIESLATLRIPEAFHSSPKSLWLYLSKNGIKEVDDVFGRGR